MESSKIRLKILKSNYSLFFTLHILGMIFISSCNDDEFPPVGEVNAEFTMTDTVINQFNSITFTDISTGDPTAWEWSFEGGTPSTSTEQNPTVSYSEGGIYNVTLTVSNPASANSITKSEIIVVIPTANLVAYYPFNGDANDLSGNGFNGTFFGSPTLTSDRNSSANSAYSFDGVDDWIETSTEIDQLLENGFTFSAWIYLEQLNQNTHTIFSNYNGNSPTGNCNTRIGFQFRVNGNGALRIFYAWDGNDRFGRDSDAGTIQLNTWYHLIATWDGNISTTGFKLYLNAVRIDKNDYSEGFFNCGGFLESLDPIRIGINECGSTQGPCHPFAGKIDDIRIYERILNEIEIDALSNE